MSCAKNCTKEDCFNHAGREFVPQQGGVRHLSFLKQADFTFNCYSQRKLNHLSLRLISLRLRRPRRGRLPDRVRTTPDIKKRKQMKTEVP
jgi:hypothetical protein